MQVDVEDPFQFTNGVFEWNHFWNGLEYTSFDNTKTSVIGTEINVSAQKTSQIEFQTYKYDIGFKDDFDLIEKIKFKKRYRRKTKLNEPKIILLQDIKDVTLFTANMKNLCPEFISLLHTHQIDHFFRALIVYFQLYLQTWEELRERRYELERKIPQPTVKNSAAEDLADLRCILAREYFSLLIGTKEVERYHHIHNRMSLSERDRTLCELLIQFSSRIVWYALNKPLLGIIEQECDRIARSCHYNKYENNHALRNLSVATFTEGEKRILRGRTDIEEKRLVSKSPIGKELMIGNHDHRLLAIGYLDFPPSDARLRYIEKLILLPEEDLAKNGICIGILGMPRENFDVILKYRHKASSKDTEELVFKFEIPSSVEYSDDFLPWNYPTAPPIIAQKDRSKLLSTQCKIWLYRFHTSCQSDSSVKDYTVDSCASIIM